MGQVFSDRARGKLDGNITGADTVFFVADGDFPSATLGASNPEPESGGSWFKAVITHDDDYEIVYVRTHDHVNTPGAFSNVLRGQDGTAAKSWPEGSIVGIRPVASDAALWQSKQPREVGKGLSDENYTAADKSKLDGIEAGAQVNAVTSVAGKTGAVSLVASDVGLGSVSNDAQLKAASNLSDLNNAATARTNLGLGSAAVKDVPLSGDATGAQVVLGNDSRIEEITQALAEGGTDTAVRGWTSKRVRQAIVSWWNNLGTAFGRGFISLADAAAGRDKLGLGTAASRDVGTSAGNVMEVGAFGVGRYYTEYVTAPDGEEFHDITLPSSFARFSVNVQIPAGMPASYGSILSFPYSSDQNRQIRLVGVVNGPSRRLFYQNTSLSNQFLEIAFTTLARHTSTTLAGGSFHHINANITIPTIANGAPPVGSIIPCYLSANTQRTVSAASGVTLRHSGTTNTGTATIKGYGSFTLSHVDMNEWRISGDLV